ncbi:aryl-sulfate sulfotransferase [Sediminibacter sp. Hel_I_10]|uniref:aryl-sulfate sulfotransferase n=1 Tax=Sediminibacter sp. Hel_I_10 TaxID=1392490 RepID=UPI00047B50FA|nr:aryl-sulfate sulfotransferase [Sediminibacter sp. Hel_I_10]
MKQITLGSILLCFLSFLACNNNDNDVPIEEEDDSPVLTENVEVYDDALLENGFVLVVENGGNTSFFIDKAGNRVKEYDFGTNLGNDLELLENGKLLGIFKSDNPTFSFGGYGGKIRIMDDQGNIEWEYINSDDNQLSHHDVELLPNGNVLFIVWERITAEEAQANGVNTEIDIFPEVLLEVNPNTNLVEWQWRSFEHIIQDFDSAASQFGVIGDHPELIDVNYNTFENGDFMHANGLDYDPIKDIVYLSVNFYSEVWVIDHSTTTTEASLDTGGNYNKGGDLIYRFGNPEAYHNSVGSRLFHNNHFPNILEENEIGAGNLLIFNNGIDVSQSTVYELDIPDTFSLIPNADNEPDIVWSFTDPDLFHGRISGAVRLKNGNTLITEGDYGFWEVTDAGEIAWKYNGLIGNIWRGYGYTQDEQAIIDLGL